MVAAPLAVWSVPVGSAIQAVASVASLLVQFLVEVATVGVAVTVACCEQSQGFVRMLIL